MNKVLLGEIIFQRIPFAPSFGIGYNRLHKIFIYDLCSRRDVLNRRALTARVNNQTYKVLHLVAWTFGNVPKDVPIRTRLINPMHPFVWENICVTYARPRYYSPTAFARPYKSILVRNIETGAEKTFYESSEIFAYLHLPPRKLKTGDVLLDAYEVTLVPWTYWIKNADSALQETTYDALRGSLSAKQISLRVAQGTIMRM